MNLRQLEIFNKVAEQQSFSKAAKQLYIAQSAVSIAIAKLEDNLNLKLFNRADKKVSLTPEGEVLKNHAQTVIKQVADTRLELEEMQGLTRGEVRIGCSAMLASYYFPTLFAEFKARFPKLKISIVDAGAKRIEMLLEQGALDIGIIDMQAVTPQLETRKLISEEMLICVPKTHPFAKQKSVTFKQLLSQELIVYQEGYLLRDIINRLFEEQGITASISIETNLVQLMKTMVLSELGISFCLHSVLKEEKNLRGVSLKPAITLNFGIAWKKDHYLSVANQAFIKFLLSKKE